MTSRLESRAMTVSRRLPLQSRPRNPICKRRRSKSRPTWAFRHNAISIRQRGRMTHATGTAYKSPLHKMTQTTPTCLWNDSASIQELTYSIEHGAVGATCNPVIVHGILKKELANWKVRIEALLREFPMATEDEIAWKVVREISVRAAALLKPVFDAHGGKNGRLSIQTDP